MTKNLSNHAALRQQQRGVPPLITNWLVNYGDKHYDGHGGVVCYFSKRCIRRLEREVGTAPVKRMSEFFRCYLVKSAVDDTVITVGKLYPNNRITAH